MCGGRRETWPEKEPAPIQRDLGGKGGAKGLQSRMEWRAFWKGFLEGSSAALCSPLQEEREEVEVMGSTLCQGGLPQQCVLMSQDCSEAQ